MGTQIRCSRLQRNLSVLRSVFSDALPDKERPLIYISMGTVINDRPGFYSKCIDALKDVKADVMISCGNAVKREELVKSVRRNLLKMRRVRYNGCFSAFLRDLRKGKNLAQDWGCT